LPVGIGLKHVLVINASMSDSYHIFKQPEAPAPNATKKIPIIAFKVSIFEFDVKYPTAQVKITRDITLGFINNNKDLLKDFKSTDEDVLFLIILLGKINLH
jgi:hypothetical protein